jgi:hypothetical protein
VLLFHLGQAIAFWPLQRFFHAKIQLDKPIPEFGPFIRASLRLLKVVQYDKESNKWMAGENIEFISSFYRITSRPSC